MSRMVVLIGSPAAGKSTLAAALESQGYAVVSSDRIREELYGSQDAGNNDRRVFRIMGERVDDHLRRGDDVVIDAVNSTVMRRDIWLGIGRIHGATPIAYRFVAEDPKVLIDRNIGRGNRPIPAGAMVSINREVVRTPEHQLVGEGFESVHTLDVE